MKPCDQASRVNAIDPSGFDMVMDDRGEIFANKTVLNTACSSIGSGCLQGGCGYVAWLLNTSTIQ